MRDILLFLGLFGASACASPVGSEPAYADLVIDAPGARDAMFGDPALATNGVRGAGAREGSVDVFSLRYGEHLTLGWGGRRVVDGPGADFAVFENGFEFGEDATFMDPVIVELSRDGHSWVELPHDYRATDESRYSTQRADWVGFAGIEPVALHAEDNPVDPFDPAAGGDAFDLASLGDDPESEAIRVEGFRFLRLSPAADHDNPDTGGPFVRDVLSDGPDIDGVHARYLETDPS